MSFLTKAEGEVEAVVAKIDEAAEHLGGNVASFFHDALRGLVRDIEADLAGKGRGKVTVKIQTDGHFDENGLGGGTIHVETVPVNAAGETPPPSTPA